MPKLEKHVLVAGAAAGTVVGFDIDSLSERLSIIIMLLFSSIALTQIAVTSHKQVPYSTIVERYMSLGCVGGCNAYPLCDAFFACHGTIASDYARVFLSLSLSLSLCPSPFPSMQGYNVDGGDFGDFTCRSCQFGRTAASSDARALFVRWGAFSGESGSSILPLISASHLSQCLVAHLPIFR